MDKVNEFLKKNYKSKMIGGSEFASPTKRIECLDGFSISVQANDYTYCTPRKNKAWPYSEVELGFPSKLDRLISRYAEESKTTETVFPMVPISVVNALIEKHGGIK